MKVVGLVHNFFSKTKVHL